MLQVKNKQKLKRKWRKRPVLTGLLKFEIMKDRRPDRGLGPYRSYYFAVLIGPGPVQSRSFSGPETGPPSTSSVAAMEGGCPLSCCRLSLCCSYPL